MTDHAETLETLKAAARTMAQFPAGAQVDLRLPEFGGGTYYTLALETLRAAGRLAAPPPHDSKVGPWRIWYDPPPIGTRIMDWHYQHEDCDGPESPAWMTGSCASRDACIEEIFESYEDRIAEISSAAVIRNEA